jgi:hypothetical protein
MSLKTGVASLTAIVAWAALALQLLLLVENMMADGATLAASIWRFLGFFTILTNGMVAVVATAMVLRPSGRLAAPLPVFVTATAILFVGLVYSVALRSVWEPTGWQAVADHALHDATPVLFFLAWALSEHVALRWQDALWALLPPLAYCVYALARGAVDGWYAYWFLDPRALTLMQLGASMIVLLVAFLCLAFGLIAIDRWLASRRRER